MEDDDNLAGYLAARSMSHRGRQGKNLYEAIMDVSALTLSFMSVFPLFFVLLLFRRMRKPSQTYPTILVLHGIDTILCLFPLVDTCCWCGYMRVVNAGSSTEGAS